MIVDRGGNDPTTFIPKGDVLQCPNKCAIVINSEEDVLPKAEEEAELE